MTQKINLGQMTEMTESERQMREKLKGKKRIVIKIGSSSLTHPETGELLLGDIVISKDRVIAQAEEYGHEIKREYAFLIAHSMLHLFGYDHMEEEERKTMERMQNEILNALNIVR